MDDPASNELIVVAFIIVIAAIFFVSNESISNRDGVVVQNSQQVTVHVDNSVDVFRSLSTWDIAVIGVVYMPLFWVCVMVMFFGLLFAVIDRR